MRREFTVAVPEISDGRGSFARCFREPNLIIVRFGCCGSGLRFRRFAVYVLRKCDFIGKASEYLYWFISSPIDSVSHWLRVSDVRHFL